MYNISNSLIDWRFSLGVEQDYSAPMTVDSLSELRKSVLNRIYLVLLFVGGIAKYCKGP